MRSGRHLSAALEHGRYPLKASFDGGFACKDNLQKAKSRRIKDVCFAKKRGLKETDMCRSQYVYRSLRCFRAGIESGISWLERCLGLTNRNRGKSLRQVIKELNMYLRGWWNYFRLIDARYILKSLKTWIIRRLRCLVWKQWKNPRTKVRNLEKLGIDHVHAVTCGNARKKYWRMSKVKWVAMAMPEHYFVAQGLYLPGN